MRPRQNVKIRKHKEFTKKAVINGYLDKKQCFYLSVTDLYWQTIEISPK